MSVAAKSALHERRTSAKAMPGTAEGRICEVIQKSACEKFARTIAQTPSQRKTIQKLAAFSGFVLVSTKRSSSSLSAFQKLQYRGFCAVPPVASLYAGSTLSARALRLAQICSFPLS